MTRLLVVTADDVGLTPGVNAAVHRAHVEGVVTAASVLAVGRAFDDAARMLRATPTLAVGAHLALVGEDPPLLSAREVPTLVDRAGAFPLGWRTVVRRGVLGRIDPDDVRRELAAQLERVRDVGVPLTHLDTHQHTHLWPAVARVVADLAVEHGVPVVRTPTSHARSPLGLGVRALARTTRRTVRGRGLASSADYAGLDEAGGMDHARFARTLTAAAHRGAATLEVNTHPALADDPDLGRFDWGGYAWGEELAMLVDPATRDLVDRQGYRLVGPGRLAEGVAR